MTGPVLELSLDLVGDTVTGTHVRVTMPAPADASSAYQAGVELADVVDGVLHGYAERSEQLEQESA